jgi:hypothetical protein
MPPLSTSDAPAPAGPPGSAAPAASAGPAGQPDQEDSEDAGWGATAWDRQGPAGSLGSRSGGG